MAGCRDPRRNRLHAGRGGKPVRQQVAKGTSEPRRRETDAWPVTVAGRCCAAHRRTWRGPANGRRYRRQRRPGWPGVWTL